jgi:hypothetical protein
MLVMHRYFNTSANWSFNMAQGPSSCKHSYKGSSHCLALHPTLCTQTIVADLFALLTSQLVSGIKPGALPTQHCLRHLALSALQFASDEGKPYTAVKRRELLFCWGGKGFLNALQQRLAGMLLAYN